jgi:hypothetical protein
MHAVCPRLYLRKSISLYGVGTYCPKIYLRYRCDMGTKKEKTNISPADLERFAALFDAVAKAMSDAKIEGVYTKSLKSGVAGFVRVGRLLGGVVEGYVNHGATTTVSGFADQLIALNRLTKHLILESKKPVAEVPILSLEEELDRARTAVDAGSVNAELDIAELRKQRKNAKPAK